MTAADLAKSRKATKQLRTTRKSEIMNLTLHPSSKSLAGPTIQDKMLLEGGPSKLGMLKTLKVGR